MLGLRLGGVAMIASMIMNGYLLTGCDNRDTCQKEEDHLRECLPNSSPEEPNREPCTGTRECIAVCNLEASCEALQDFVNLSGMSKSAALVACIKTCTLNSSP
jgi:hypothetical protein